VISEVPVLLDQEPACRHAGINSVATVPLACVHAIRIAGRRPEPGAEDRAMRIADIFLAQLEHEAGITRTILERVPDDLFGYRPHPRSGTMGWLGSHLADIVGWAKPTIEVHRFDLAAMPEWLPAGTGAELLVRFERGYADARTAISGASDELLRAPWSLAMGDKTMFTMPRIAVLRGFVLSHLIHHRAQLGMYFRLCDIPVPATYGPSADDRAGM
jgi:uncharacterized damage-inducible protein DinB